MTLLSRSPVCLFSVSRNPQKPSVSSVVCAVSACIYTASPRIVLAFLIPFPPNYCLSPISVLLFEQFQYSFRSTFSVVEIQNREQHEQQRRGHPICFAIRRPLQSLWCCEFRKPNECVGFSSGIPISIYFYFFSFPISSGSCQRGSANRDNTSVRRDDRGQISGVMQRDFRSKELGEWTRFRSAVIILNHVESSSCT